MEAVSLQNHEGLSNDPVMLSVLKAARVRSEIKDRYGVSIEGMVDDEAAEAVMNDLGRVYPPLLLPTRTIVFTDQLVLGEGLFDPKDVETILIGRGARYEIDEERRRVVPITDEYQYVFSNLPHEMAHAKQFQGNHEFTDRWAGIVGEMPRPSGLYEEMFEEMFGEEWEEPRHGFVRGYGTKRYCGIWHEDVATYVEEIYAPDFGNFRKADPEDARYRQKLGLLREYDFISQEQFEGALAVLGEDLER
ncbi:MAG: hypothetical protein HYW25_04650 [Candidatus Aenigmarchaeota archaeon]|nr:hypothetical protein [Candidatus Aenigmarchaeota archaeon]